MTPSGMDSTQKNRRNRRRKSRLKRWSKLPRTPAIRREFTILPTRKTLTYAEAQKFVDVLTSGQVHRLNVTDAIDIETSGETIAAIEMEQEEPEYVKADLLETKKLEPFCNVVESKGWDAQVKRSGPFVLTPAYFRCFEKTQEELDEEVEYDVDEEDIAWLKLLNDHRKTNKLQPATLDDLEFALDRLEKEAHALTTLSPGSGSDRDLPRAEGSTTERGGCVCCVCRESSSSATNSILTCNTCGLSVHQDCYGVPYHPDGQWLCRKCLKSPNAPVKCCLCPCPWKDKEGPGAMKQTVDGRWVHIVCALFIPEVSFGSNVYLEPVERIDKVPKWRHDAKCCGCNKASQGACLGCQAPSCTRFYHAVCAIRKGCHVKLFGSTSNAGELDSSKQFSSKRTGDRRTRIFFCPEHVGHSSGGLEVGPDTPGPDRESPRPTAETELNPSIATPTSREPQSIPSKAAAKKQKSTKKPRRSNQLNCSTLSGVDPAMQLSVPIVVPNLPQESLVSIGHHLAVRDRQQLMMRIHRYWLLKRHSRQGFPLIQRLQQILLIHHILKMKSSTTGLPPLDEESMQSLKKLRQDYEKVRLLLELIRKRERIKMEMLKMKEDVVELTLQPFRRLLRHTLEQLKSRDPFGLFAQPVTEEEAPGYSEVIQRPMDYSTMASKIDNHSYRSMDDFQRDFDLIINNCLEFNGIESPLYKIALKHSKQCSVILESARRMCERANYCPATGLHSDKLPLSTPDTEGAIERGRGEGEGGGSEPAGRDESDGIDGPEQDLNRKLDELYKRLDVLHVVKSKGAFLRVKQLRKEISLTKRKMTCMQHCQRKNPGPEPAFDKKPEDERSGSPVVPEKSSKKKRRSSEDEAASDSTILEKSSAPEDGTLQSKRPRLSTEEILSSSSHSVSGVVAPVDDTPRLPSPEARQDLSQLQPAKFRPVSRRNRLNGSSVLLNPNGKIHELHSTPVSVGKIKRTNATLKETLSFISPVKEDSTLSHVADENKEPLSGEKGLASCRMKLRSCSSSARVKKMDYCFQVNKRIRKPSKDQGTKQEQECREGERGSLDFLPEVSPEPEVEIEPKEEVKEVKDAPKRMVKISRRISRRIKVRSRPEEGRVTLVDKEVDPSDACNPPVAHQKEPTRRFTRSSGRISLRVKISDTKCSTVVQKFIKSSFIEKALNLSPEDEKMLTTYPVVLMEKSTAEVDVDKRTTEEIDSSYESSYSLDSVENTKGGRGPASDTPSPNDSCSPSSRDESRVTRRQVLHELDSKEANITSKTSQSNSSSISSKGAEDPFSPLSPGDVVWAKTKGYPWYPAMIITRDILPTEEPSSYYQNQVPPEVVSALRSKFSVPLHLVRFFDRRKNWQWLPRCKLDAIGVDPLLDRERMNSVRQSKLKRDMRRAYDAALLHRRAALGKLQQQQQQQLKKTTTMHSTRRRGKAGMRSKNDGGVGGEGDSMETSGILEAHSSNSTVEAFDKGPEASQQQQQRRRQQQHPQLNCSRQFLSASAPVSFQSEEDSSALLPQRREVFSCSV